MRPVKSKKAILCDLTPPEAKKKYLGLHVKCPILNKSEFSRRIFLKFSNNNLTTIRPVKDTCEQRGRRTELQPDTVPVQEIVFMAI